jgi:hypothetical protein
LASKHTDWFPDQLLLVTQFSITHHLPLLRSDCTSTIIAGNINGSGLIAHLDGGKGDLSKDSVLMTELFTARHTSYSGYAERMMFPNTSPVFYETD